MKTIVFAYSEFGCIGIEALIKAGYDIAAVYTYRDDPRENVFYRSVAKVCVENDLRAYEVEKLDDPAWLSGLKALQPDYIFSFYYRSLLPDAVLALAREGAFNVHGSLLPRYRGRAPVNWVLVKGEIETGVTLHHMVSRADAGDIVAQEKVAIDYDDTAFSLQHKLLDAARRIFATQFPLIAQGKAARIPQDITKGEYCGKRGPKDGMIDWRAPAETIRNLIRAVTRPYPGAFVHWNGRKILIWDSGVDITSSGKAPGTVLSMAPLTIACDQDSLIVKAGQIEDDGLYVSGVQLAEMLHLSVGELFISMEAPA